LILVVGGALLLVVIGGLGWLAIRSIREMDRDDRQ
jgi:hypothetical protein